MTERKLHGGSGDGCDGWTVGQTIRSGKRQRDQGWPEFVTVVTASKRFFAEDGMSFGVGDESGYRYTAACREATDEESVSAREQIANHKDRSAALREQRKNERRDGYDETAANYGR